MSVLSRVLPAGMGASETTFPGQQLPLLPLAGQRDGMGVAIYRAPSVDQALDVSVFP